MTISPKHLYIAVASLLVGLVLIIAASAYVATKMNLVRFQQVTEDMKPIHEEAKEEKKAAVKSEDQNQVVLAAVLAAIAKDRSQPVSTPVDYERIEKMIEQRMGAKAEVKPTDLPNAPSVTLDAKKLRDYMSDCDATTAKYSACTLTAQNFEKQYEAEVKDHDATKKELMAAKRAMKGGSFWARVKSNGKWFIVGGLVGGGAALAAKH